MKNSKEKNLKKLKGKYSTDYGYDFVPTLHKWTNIDEQKEKVKKLEQISKNE